MLARGDTKTADGDSIDEKQLTAKYAARLNPDRHYSRAIAFFVFTSFLLRLLFRSYFCNVLASYSLHSRIKADGSLKIDEKKKNEKSHAPLRIYIVYDSVLNRLQANADARAHSTELGNLVNV